MTFSPRRANPGADLYARLGALLLLLLAACDPGWLPAPLPVLLPFLALASGIWALSDPALARWLPHVLVGGISGGSLLALLALLLPPAGRSVAVPPATTLLVLASLAALEMGHPESRNRKAGRRAAAALFLPAGYSLGLPLGWLGVLLARPDRWLPDLRGRLRWIVPILCVTGLLVLTVGPRSPLLSEARSATAAFSLSCYLRGVLLVVLLSAVLFPVGLRIRQKMVVSFLLNGVIPVLLVGAMALAASYAFIGAALSATITRQLNALAADAKATSEAVIGSLEHRSETIGLPRALRRLLRENRLNGGLVVGHGDEVLDPYGSVPRELQRPLDAEARYYTDPYRDAPMYVVGSTRSENGLWCVSVVQADDALAEYLSDSIGLPVAIGSGLLNVRKLRYTGAELLELAPFSGAWLGKVPTESRLGLLGGGLLRDPTAPESPLGGNVVGSFFLFGNARILRDALYMRSLGGDTVLHVGETRVALRGSTETEPSPGDETAEAQPSESNLINFGLLVLGIFLAVALGVVVLASILLGFGFAQNVTSRIQRLRDGAEGLRAGDLTTRLDIEGRDELTELGQVFNSMAESLEAGARERERHLKEQLERQRLQEEVATAQLLQASFLPTHDPNMQGVSVLGFCRPAAEVGGDYYDYLPLGEQRLGLVIGDVSGHGVSAGLLMAMAKSCLYNQVQISDRVPQVMDALNRMVHDALQRKLIMTLAYMVLDASTGRVSYASAGHHFPYVLRRHGGLEVLEDVNYPLGVRKHQDYREHEQFLRPGDRMVLYSDGIVEAFSPHGEPLGFEALERELRASVGSTAVELRDRILQTVDRHLEGHPAQDDITLLIVDFTGPAGASAEASA